MSREIILEPRRWGTTKSTGGECDDDINFAQFDIEIRASSMEVIHPFNKGASIFLVDFFDALSSASLPKLIAFVDSCCQCT